MTDKPHPRDEPPALTVQQLAKRWNVSHYTVGRMIRAGRLRVFNVGLAEYRNPCYRIAYAEVLRHENGEAPGGMNEEKVAAMVKPVPRKYEQRELPPVKEFIK